MNQIELLLRLSENAQDAGDEIAEKYNQARAAHVKDLVRLNEMIKVAQQNVEAELRRFGGVATPPPQLPRDEPQTPRVGPTSPRPVRLPSDTVKAN